MQKAWSSLLFREGIRLLKEKYSQKYCRIKCIGFESSQDHDVCSEWNGILWVMKMYRIRIKSHFDAAHKLIGYNGKCANLHGHTWEVEVFITGDNLKNGMLVDFTYIKADLQMIINKLDHCFLNEIKEIGNPTVENICRYIYENVTLPEGVNLEKVRVWESLENWGEYCA